MKLKDDAEICDKCKDRVAKYVCLGCGAALCGGCSSLFRVQILTLDFKDKKELEGYPEYYNQFAALTSKTEKTAVGVTDWAICLSCRKGINNKKDALEEIQESDEFKAFVDKVRKIALKSAVLKGLDDSNIVDKEVDVYSRPKGYFTAGSATQSKSFLGKIFK